MLYDLIVVGGGPAGCATAISAARSGASVLLLERGRFPRHKVCGEFVSAESLELLNDLLSPPHHQLIAKSPRISKGRVFADGMELSLQVDPPAASVTRFDLDVALWQSAAADNVDVRQECSTRKIIGAGPFIVQSENQEFQAKAVINATGRWSSLTSLSIRARRNGTNWIGVKAHFAEEAPPASVDLYFFAGGYCGVQPIGVAENNSRVNACAMVRADVATTVEQVLQLHAGLKARSRNWKLLTDPVSTSPLVFHPPEPVQSGMLQVGDAATFVDPFIGDGISLALRSGALAAECLAPFFQGQASRCQANENYAALYQQGLAPVFHASSFLRTMLRIPQFVRRPVLSLLKRTPAITRRLVQMTR
jgi:flavin-dependent dehydrogenase